MVCGCYEGYCTCRWHDDDDFDDDELGIDPEEDADYPFDRRS